MFLISMKKPAKCGVEKKISYRPKKSGVREKRGRGVIGLELKVRNTTKWKKTLHRKESSCCRRAPPKQGGENATHVRPYHGANYPIVKMIANI